jgi:hypothetical protein
MSSVLGALGTPLQPFFRTGSTQHLPFHVDLGPYRMSVEMREPSEMSDRRRRLACVNIEEQRIELRSDLSGLRLVEAFFYALIRLSHFSKGCQQGCVEEAYTHSFATGMVEFAQRNPKAWIWFNLRLNEHLPEDMQYDRFVCGAVPAPPPMPNRIAIDGRGVPVRILSRAQAGNALGWYDFERREVQLYERLSGANVAIVALHEITHALHHAHGLRVRDRERNFVRAQLKGWFQIMLRDPAAWRWLAWTMSFPHKASVA